VSRFAASRANRGGAHSGLGHAGQIPYFPCRIRAQLLGTDPKRNGLSPILCNLRRLNDRPLFFHL